MPRKEKETISRGARVGGGLLICAALIIMIALVFFHPFDWPAGGHPEEIANPLRQLGAALAFLLVNFTFGRWGALVFPPLLFIWGISLFSRKVRPLSASLKLLALGLLLGWLIQLFSKSVGLPLPEYQFGLLSNGLASMLERFAGFTGAWIITLAALFLFLEFTIGLGFLKNLFLTLGEIWERFLLNYRRSRENRRRWKEELASSVSEESDDDSPLPSGKEPRRRKLVPEEDAEIVETEDSPPPEIEKTPPKTEETYIFPSPGLLKPPAMVEDISDEELRESAVSLESRLAEFGVQARVVAIHPGPVITRFDLQPAPGVKVSRIVALQDDLSLSMRAKSLRIMAPIPGEAAVGVEVPNPKIRTVHLRQVIESEVFTKSKSKLTLALGVDTSGNPYTAELSDMPHLLVAGTTGSGKSVCLNTILASILFQATPREVRLALIDPKKLELKVYIPLLEHHLITPPGVKEPVMTESEDALKVLKSLELEMQRRYIILSDKGHRSLEEYNENRENTRLPYIILVIDELADLMMTAGGAIETPIARLAQMGRAVGIHLIVATQRPSVDVITGLIKANFPCRIAFQVATKVDSRTIIDANGAETLLGKGDMLFLPPGSATAVRIHGSLITTREIEAIVDHVSRQPVFEDLMELPDPLEEPQRMLNLTPGTRDELFEESAKLIAVHQQGSVSLLQRKLKIGYARAARIIDQLEAAGIVGPFDGSKARKVLVDEAWLPQMGSAPENQE